MHADELPVSASLVTELIAAQFPRWRGLPVSRVDSPGTLNAIFRTRSSACLRAFARLTRAWCSLP
jgi:hypothetical protein